MKRMGPRILLMGGSYRALCVLERLLDRGERVVAFIGEEGGGERDFCPEILETCDRASIPARSGRKLGEEIVRWLEDRMRPELTISVGLRTEVPLTIGGNCRLGMIEIVDILSPGETAAVALRQSGHEVMRQAVGRIHQWEEDTAGDLYLQLAEATLTLLDAYMDQISDRHSRPLLNVPFEMPDPASEIQDDACAQPGLSTERLEQAVAAELFADRVFALPASIDAFALIFEALGVRTGDSVIVPGLTSRRAAAAVARQGALPQWVDVEAATLTLDPSRTQDAICSSTRAIIASHAFGQPADMEALEAIGIRRGVPIVQDATMAFGARVGSRPVGMSPGIAVLRIPVTAPEIERGTTFLAVPGDLASRLEPHVEKVRLSDGAARTLLGALPRYAREREVRQRNGAVYSSELLRYDAFQVPAQPVGREPVYSAFALRMTPFSRTNADDLAKLLADTGIETRQVAPLYSETFMTEIPIAERARAATLLLPVSSALTEEMRELVLDAIFDYAIG
jgi:dTDP-4-amino-4,6-dideoxygalactose transaminase